MARKSITTTITETKQTDALLGRMPSEMRNKQLRNALAAGGRVARNEARRLARN